MDPTETKPLDRGATEELAPGDRLSATLAGDDVAAKIDALHRNCFTGTALANDTAMWNLVFDFKEKVKALLAETGDATPTR